MLISSITHGGEIMRMKHLQVRMHLAIEAIIENKILVLYKNTSKMIADGLSKNLTNQVFNDFTNIILGATFMKN